ncbi:hypothetical protein Sam46_gp7 [Bacillus phage vB_BcM_Sam46]|uniref:Uncharacterized protein n=2 Tax=Caudoviricetes TaxID=2731619 RepID=A0A6G9L6S7_9CAUD|nr:hypothetical protein Sam112_gp7 [Bacillus phage vB_BcM_Sam112]QIQ61208.1 hypothetical protein Sam46_gp7 [Bacillus phage vB_BcM_Sam46]
MGLMGFNRRRREMAKLEAAAATKEQSNTNVPEEVETQQEAKLDVSKLSLKKVKEELDKREIVYAHNTGEEKLRKKLADAIN